MVEHLGEKLKSNTQARLLVQTTSDKFTGADDSLPRPEITSELLRDIGAHSLYTVPEAIITIVVY